MATRVVQCADRGPAKKQKRATMKEKFMQEMNEQLRNHIKTLEKELDPIDSEDEFFTMYDALVRDNSGFVSNRAPLLAAWKRGGELYTLRIKETQELFEERKLRIDLANFAFPGSPTPSWLTLPVFCWRDAGDACIVLWTAPHIRKLGLAKELLARLGIARAYNVLPESRSFWAHLAIPAVDELPQSGE